MKRWGCSIATGVVLILLLLAQIWVPFEAVFHLAVGWLIFLVGVVPRLSVSWSGVATAVAALALFVAGFQRLASWWYAAVNRAGEQPAQGAWKWRWTFLTAAAVVLSFVAGISLVGATHQVVWMATSREPLAKSSWDAVQRTQSLNNLHEIANALAGHLDKHQRLPAGGAFDRLGRPLFSWQTSLLPFLGETALFEEIDLELPWDAPANAAPLAHVVTPYLNPGITRREGEHQFDRSGRALSHYAGNGRVLGTHAGLPLSAFTDGASQTFIAGEVNANFKPWGHPANWRDASLGINRSPDGFGGPWTSGGACILMADGRARFISSEIDPKVLEALSTPDGGDAVGDDW